jgi:hypothetical protein
LIMNIQTTLNKEEILALLNDTLASSIEAAGSIVASSDRNFAALMPVKLHIAGTPPEHAHYVVIALAGGDSVLELYPRLAEAFGHPVDAFAELELVPGGDMVPPPSEGEQEPPTEAPAKA